MQISTQERNKALAQHSASIPSGREGLFALVRALPPAAKYEPGLIAAEGDFVMMHGRYSSLGLPADWVAVDIIRLKDGVFADHWDVIRDEVTRERSRSGIPMFGDVFPAGKKPQQDWRAQQD